MIIKYVNTVLIVVLAKLAYPFSHSLSIKVKFTDDKSQSLLCPRLVYILFKFQEMSVLNVFEGKLG